MDTMKQEPEGAKPPATQNNNTTGADPPVDARPNRPIHIPDGETIETNRPAEPEKGGKTTATEGGPQTGSTPFDIPAEADPKTKPADYNVTQKDEGATQKDLSVDAKPIQTNPGSKGTIDSGKPNEPNKSGQPPAPKGGDEQAASSS